jgi:TatD DNase family protein
MATVLARAKNNNVQHILNVCVKLADFPAVLKTAIAHPNVSASVGLHPNEQEQVTVDQLVQLGQHPKVVAIGETGLDYFRSTGDLEWQREQFRTHIRAAKILKKPLIIHTRAAKEDTIRILQEENAQAVAGVMHCFTEDLAIAEQAMAMGFAISFSGVVTFKNATAIQTVAKQIPLERLLIETDAPYLAPEPYRGKPNEPAYVKHTAEYLARLRGEPIEVFAKQTTENFFKLFTGASHSR